MLYVCVILKRKQKMTTLATVSETKVEAAILHIDARLSDWYSYVREEYGVIGSGYSKYNAETEEVEIYYEENGVKCLFRHYWNEDFNISTIYDIWQTEADVNADAIA